MPRIRKKTSNRQGTNDRRKIQRKVRESRKKAKKAAKNNPQWKSKTAKDPGIPNNFPFKDQILAEVAEQRRIEAAEKLRKKEERKALRAKTKNPDVENTSDENAEGTGDETIVEVEELKGLQIGNDAVGGIGAKQLLHAKTFSRPPLVLQPEKSDENEVPVLINHDLPNLETVLSNADVVIEVLDARDPLPCRSSHLEGLVAAKAGQKLLLLLNKIDICPLESVIAWATYLRTHHPTLLFRSASAFLPLGPEPSAKGKAKAPTDDALGVDSVLEWLGHCATTKKGDGPLTVAIVGVTNAGKSSLINSLIRSSSLPVYSTESSSRGPTTTELPQEVLVESGGKQIRLIDTPGLSWEVDESAENPSSIRARDILLRSKGRIDRLKDPTSVVATIVARSNTEDLMLLYNLPAFMDGDSMSFLSGVARSKQLVKKHGQLDIIGASRILLRDWSTGKFARYSTPPTTTISTTCYSKTQDTVFEKLYGSDSTILETVISRKQLRKSVGLVKISSGEVDSRKVVLRDSWLEESDSEGDDEEDNDAGFDGDDDSSQEEADQNGDDGDGSNNGDDHEAALPLPKKQKRKQTDELLVAPPSKKVAFAPDFKVAKQIRKSASIRGKISDRTPTESVSKATIKPANAKLRIQHKVVNVGAKSKATKKGADNGDDEAYDFGKFF
ncbi:hypothetical protein H2248_005911 [Termitomyces sp. 'cryptogamus']|nr:hypothetical protein H2248_005911 [Termitomyces sp. 'cryptogamus']